MWMIQFKDSRVKEIEDWIVRVITMNLQSGNTGWQVFTIEGENVFVLNLDDVSYIEKLKR